MRILVSASDPGGAYAILPVVKALKKKNSLTLVLGGKARDVFRSAGFSTPSSSPSPRSRFGEAGPYHGGEKNFDFNLFLAGTSFGPTIDKKLLLQCKIRKIPSVYVLDFWSNYWQRFSTGKKDFKFLPDYICVMDEKAKQEMVREGFPSSGIVVTGNPYFEQFIRKTTKVKQDYSRILFISQPLARGRKHKQLENYGYDEFRVLSDILDVLKQVRADLKLTVRLHPKEDKNKYQNLPIVYDPIKDIRKSLVRSGLIIGMNSAALFEAALLGANIISYQPGLKGKDRLPSNALGLSKLAASKSKLLALVRYYFQHKNLGLQNNKKRSILIRHSTENIVKFIRLRILSKHRRGDKSK